MQRLLLTKEQDMLHLAVLEDERLVELYCERAGEPSQIGNLFLGRVDNVLPGMRAAFVDIGLEKNGFLSLDDIAIPNADDAKGALEAASKPLKPGNELIVQVFKQPGGDKGARLTCHITIAGKWVVLLPTVQHLGVSRKIDSSAEHRRLNAILENQRPEGMGLIARTAAEGVDEAIISQEIAELAARWRTLSEHAKYLKPPCLLDAAPDLADRAARDMLPPDAELVVDDREIYERIKGPQVRLHQSDTPLFALHRVPAQAETRNERRVWLKSGGYIVVDRTEAMTVIDVNTGKFVGKRSLEDTLLQLNSEAAIEIARQLRLRDVGGIVIIDFIDMEREGSGQALLETLGTELKKDRTKTNLCGMTQLGLVELTRKKIGSGAPARKKTSKENT